MGYFFLQLISVALDIVIYHNKMLADKIEYYKETGEMLKIHLHNIKKNLNG